MHILIKPRAVCKGSQFILYVVFHLCMHISFSCTFYTIPVISFSTYIICLPLHVTRVTRLKVIHLYHLQPWHMSSLLDLRLAAIQYSEGCMQLFHTFMLVFCLWLQVSYHHCVTLVLVFHQHALITYTSFYLLTNQTSHLSPVLDIYHICGAITVHAEGSRKEQKARTEGKAGVD